MIGTTAALVMGGLSAAGSLAGGFMSAGGAQAGGAAATQMSQNAATTNANIQRDQMMRNRVDASPYMAGGREAMSRIGMLSGWGNLETGGGDDDWRFAGWGGSGDQAQFASQQTAARKSLQDEANAGWKDVALPSFSEWNPTLLNVPTSFQADPGYNWRISEGNKALDRSASAKGDMFSGGQLKALTDYNQGAASQEYGNWWNRYTGSTAANNSATQASTGFNNAARQQDYGNRYGQAGDAYNRYQGAYNNLLRLAGMGQGSQSATSSLNTGMSSQIGNGFLTAGLTGANATNQAYVQSGNAMASGIGGGINNLITAGAMGGAFGGGGGWGSIPAPPSPPSNVGSVGGMPTNYYRGWT